MTGEDRARPADELPDDGDVNGTAADAKDDENEVKAQGGWGGVGTPDS